MATLGKKSTAKGKGRNFPKKMEQKYIRILLHVMIYGCVDSQTIHLLLKRDNDVTEILRRAVEADHIKKVNYRFYHKNHCKDITAYRITRKGVKYIACKNQIKALTEMSDELLNNIEIITKSERRKNRYEIAIRQAKVAIMSAIAGAHVNVLELTPEFEEEAEENSLIEFLARNVTPQDTEFLNKNISWNKYDDNELLQFYDGTMVKQIASDDQDENSALYKTTQVKGILTSQHKTVMMYAPPLFGLTWNAKNNRRELYVYRKWVNKYKFGKWQAGHSTMAMIVVNNSRDFFNLYTDKYKVQNNQSEFGGEFDKVYIVPCTYIGADFMHFIMTTDDDEVIRNVVTESVEDWGLYYNSRKTKRFFQLRDSTGCEMAICMQFDVKLLRQIDEYVSVHQETEFKIICYDWQMSYYQKVLPSNVTYATIEYKEA